MAVHENSTLLINVKKEYRIFLGYTNFHSFNKKRNKR